MPGFEELSPQKVCSILNDIAGNIEDAGEYADLEKIGPLLEAISKLAAEAVDAKDADTCGDCGETLANCECADEDEEEDSDEG